MAGWLAVLVDNRELVKVVRLRHGAGGTVNLTTMLAGQHQAVVQVYLRTPRLRERIHTFHLNDLTTRPERPRIVVSAHVRDDVTVALRVNGELREERRVPIPDDARRPAIAGWLVPALLILLIGAAAIWWISRGQDDTRSGFAAATADRIAAVLAPVASVPDVSVPAEADAIEPEAVPSNGGDAADPDAVADPWTIYFEPDSATITDDARRRIEELAAAIAGSREPRAAQTVEVMGHTALFGTEASRIELSERRAAAVARMLQAMIDESELTVAGSGGADPVTLDPDRQAENRRVEIRTLP